MADGYDIWGGEFMACEKAFLQQLRRRGFRLTAQRQMVLSVLHDLQGFVTAEEVYARVQRISSAVDISTVYRTLDLLQKLDLVSRVDTGDGQHHYELLGVQGPHMHLTCLSCGQVIAAGLESAQAFARCIQAEYGFQVAVEHLSVPGLCRTCAAAQPA